MKIAKNFRYEEEIIKHADKNPFIRSFAEWACDRYKQEFLSLNVKLSQLQTLKVKEGYLLTEIKKLQKSANKHTVTKKERKELKGMQKRLKRSSFEGCYKSFIHETSSEINRKQFKLLVDKYGKD